MTTTTTTATTLTTATTTTTTCIDPKSIQDRPQIDLEQPRIDPESTSNRPLIIDSILHSLKLKVQPKSIPKQLQINPESIPNGVEWSWNMNAPELRLNPPQGPCIERNGP